MPYNRDTNCIEVPVEYSRIAYADVGRFKCDGCGKVAICLSVDTSEGEYGSITVCRECIANLFANHKPKG